MGRVSDEKERAETETGQVETGVLPVIVTIIGSQVLSNTLGAHDTVIRYG